VNVLHFTKMQAQGNDFVVLDGRKRRLPALDVESIRTLSDRRLGVGCDQVLVMEPGGERSDAVLRVFNSDGSEAANCGNGLRCIAHLLLEERGTESVSIELDGRIHSAERSGLGIRVHMGEACIHTHTATYTDVEIGNLHRVIFETGGSMPTDRNIEIVGGMVGDEVYVEIIERGAGRTPACGSGACAVAAAVWTAEGCTRPLKVRMPGGEVTVMGEPESIWLDGRVNTVFTGEYPLSV